MSFFKPKDFNETYPKLLTMEQAAKIGNEVLGKRTVILTAQGGSKWLCYGEYKEESDTPEKILKEMVEKWSEDGCFSQEYIYRAKKLLVAR